MVKLERLRAEGKNYQILQHEGEGHNINEAAYEKDLFTWLKATNHYNPHAFVTHQKAATKD